ncbi:MAG: hypothetical protein ACRYHQ_39295 [Janthinobacterium lividum]
MTIPKGFFQKGSSMKILMCAAILALPVAAFAQPASVTNSKGSPDAMQFCYLNGQPYSEGAKDGNQVCVRPHSINAYDNTLLPLRWEAAARSR